MIENTDDLIHTIGLRADNDRIDHFFTDELVHITKIIQDAPTPILDIWQTFLAESSQRPNYITELGIISYEPSQFQRFFIHADDEKAFFRPTGDNAIKNISHASLQEGKDDDE